MRFRDLASSGAEGCALRAAPSRRVTPCLLLACALLVAPLEARAYTIGSSVTADCHERLTLAALRDAPLSTTASLEAHEHAQRLANVLPVTFGSDERDPVRVAAVIGARNPDLQGQSPSRFTTLVAIHADPLLQAPHCLRAPGDDDDAGNASALAACRAAIESELDAAFEGSPRETVRVWLAFGGTSDVELDRFGFHLGRALHALQDAFTHQLRSDDGRHVRHVLNYVDPLERDYDPARDGHHHLDAIDDCRRPDPIVQARYEQASEASRALVLAVVCDGSVDDKRQRAASVLDRWLALDPQPCGGQAGEACADAPELAVRSTGCQAAPALAAGVPEGGLLGLLAITVVCLVLRRRTDVLVVLLATVATASPLAAQEVSDPETIVAPEAEPAPSDVAQRTAAEAEAQLGPDAEVIAVHPAEREVTIREVRRVQSNDLGVAVNDGVGVAARVFGGVDQVVFGGAIGVRWPVATWLILGADLEYDGWHSLEAAITENGVAALYLTATAVWTTFDRVEVRSAIHAGASMLLFDYPGADAGAVGPFVGVTPLALAIRLSREVRLVLEPGGVFFAIPELGQGVPLVHRHHRFAAGLEITP